jgi:hypothetical protein
MFGNEVVGLEHALDVRSMDADCDVHYHLLGMFSNVAIDAEEVRLLKSEAEKKVRLNSEMTEGEKLTSCNGSRNHR